MPAIANALRRLNPWHKGNHLTLEPWNLDGPPPPPRISISAAYGLLVLYALSYFVPFYLSKATRPSPALSRDAPSVIRARIRFVTLSCLACTVVTYQVLTRAGGTTPLEALHLLGLWPVALRDSLRVLFLTALLFAGPLYSCLIVERGWADWVRLQPLVEVWEEWTTWRNIVAGPVTEEVLFRAASIPLVLLARVPPPPTVFLTPVVFGLAHVHHYYEFRLTRPDVPAAASLLRSAFQLAYTTLFGAYATFLFLRTGSLAAVCAVHAFCNCMGLPQLWGRVDPPFDVAAGVPLSRRPRPSILWTVIYYVLLVAGAVLWYRNLWVLSESENALLPSSAFDASVPSSA
ncbi:hypothetical protein MYCTH_49425 [Thermothelomyces thermophilus ATCC 42464]|uniref:intramembrane prenyl-peptidase Rce1 n=1 Tax=Thermothelomyces thermophilus (strain ATCC 42464 / BCRC 31852 / DSM 1799) TaxID=573729 RepID=G2QE99_THET4|nr:uncharacterized protein MYCTH_49425 [Thermothelomyces thermophilus ATCC 42464]AEO57682.1 hypothetical protein MYCTH_49425 [Thermothelomyces thermophilus ATCC 42464]